MILPAITAILVLLLLGAVAGMTQVRLEEAARAGARAAARGESTGVTVATAQRIAGSQATVDLASGADWVRVRVAARIEGPLSGIFETPLVAEAAARLEEAIP